MNKETYEFYSNTLLRLNETNKKRENKRGYIIKIDNLYRARIGNYIVHCREDILEFLLRNKTSYIKNITILSNSPFIERTKMLNVKDLYDLLHQVAIIKSEVFIRNVCDIEQYLARAILRGTKIERRRERPYGVVVYYKGNKAEILTEHNLILVGDNLKLSDISKLRKLYVDCLDISNITSLDGFLCDCLDLCEVHLKNFNLSHIKHYSDFLRHSMKLKRINLEDFGLSMRDLLEISQQSYISFLIRDKIKELLSDEKKLGKVSGT